LKRDPKSLLWDAHEAAEAIGTMTAGKTFADFDADLILRSAVERQFEIDRPRVWRVVEDDLPGLRSTSVAMLAS